MKTKAILIGVGVLAVAAGAYFIFRKKENETGAGKSLDTGSGSATDMPQAIPGPISSDLGSFDTSLFGTSAASTTKPASRKEIRRDCRKEARAACGTGLGKGKPKCRRNFRRDCKAAGGFDDGGADFAFNGYPDFALN